MGTIRLLSSAIAPGTVYQILSQTRRTLFRVDTESGISSAYRF